MADFDNDWYWFYDEFSEAADEYGLESDWERADDTTAILMFTFTTEEDEEVELKTVISYAGEFDGESLFRVRTDNGEVLVSTPRAAFAVLYME